MWRSYQAEWRDLFVVDSAGVVTDKRNLTEFDLTVEQNVVELADLLRDM